MTPTERIATALLGWVKEEVSPWPQRNSYRKSHMAVCVNPSTGQGPHGTWPDFTTLDGCREMEDALEAKGLHLRYVHFIEELTMIVDRSTNGWDESWSMMRATATQRVAACLRTLDEGGL